MPWKVEQRDGEFCVIKEAGGDVEGCHASAEKAHAQLEALNASEEKAGDIETKNFDEPCVIVPGPTSFAELDALQEADEKAADMQQITHQFQMLVGNVMSSPGIDDKGAAVEALAGELSQRMSAVKAKPGLVERVKAVFRKEPEPEEQKSLMVYKSGDTYRWATIYSNAYRDQDNPAEIISKAAHEGFVQAVDNKEWDYPVLEWWHLENAPLGTADLVFWDKSTNCAWAAGDFDSKKIAEVFAGCKEQLGVSHGMPRSEIQRDPDDATVITRYRSKEISLLPASVAANKLTGLYSKETKMNEQQKLDALRTLGLDPESLGAAKQAEAEAKGLESKDATPEPEAEAPVAPPPLTADDIAAALQAVMTPVVARLEALENGLKEVKAQPAPEPPAPGQSILDALKGMSIVGDPAALLDGRKARHIGPTETKAETPMVDGRGSLFNSIVGPILDGSLAKDMNEHMGVA